MTGQEAGSSGVSVSMALSRLMGCVHCCAGGL